MDISFKIPYFISMFPKILQLFPETIKVAFWAFFLSLFFALVLAIIRQYKIKGLYFLSSVYVSFFRETPFIGQLFLFYYGFAQVSKTIRSMSPFTALIIALSANYCAFMSEDIRAALNSVEKGQYEAGLSIGLKPLSVLKRIILPQAARIAIPGLSNNFISLLKSTAIGFMIGYKDMMAIVSMETSRSYRFLEGYTAAMLLYWGIISLLSYIQTQIEFRLNRIY
ncbi:amino acid ABC transporter permease [Clostridiaceae bacterium 68-1-5]|uniref:Amino acid ABC transporter permease n=1 Tax=Suipraeoptans intestinalis TaxID=2606628 RepID=A0A6N7UZV4_9FIRM|nr:amino acid ABC transporter permease [Suipraeoptans intestinalis]MSR93410.1 amino acid ABC transporter permease [Suipraeoptans intestinalis]